MQRQELVKFLNEYLQIADYNDASNNGLQVEGMAEVNTIGFTVDASLEAFQKAAQAKVQMLIVHHGLFWSKPLMVCGNHKQRLHTLLQADISLYGAHLPLDAHPEVGNNAETARILGLKLTGNFANLHGKPIGMVAAAEQPVSLASLQQRLAHSLGVAVSTWPFKNLVQQIGIVTGSAGSVIDEAIALGFDALVCGELGHSYYNVAKEAGLGVVLGGHYATETVGLRALMRLLSSKFALNTIWLDVPTGL